VPVGVAPRPRITPEGDLQVADHRERGPSVGIVASPGLGAGERDEDPGHGHARECGSVELGSWESVLQRAARRTALAVSSACRRCDDPDQSGINSVC
jgi:hypothetical protein